MARKIKKVLGFLNTLFVLKNIKYSVLFLKNFSNWKPFSTLSFNVKDNNIISKDGKSSFSTKWLLKFNYSILNLENAIKQFLFFEENGKLYFSPKASPNIRFNLYMHDSLNAAREIFNECTYNFNTNREVIVFDIGANVGISALYFANNPKIKKVICYEPFLETIDLFEGNLELNKKITEKIEINKFGLSDVNQIKKVPQMPSGFMGFTTYDNTLERFKNENLKYDLTEIELKKSSVELKSKIQPYLNLDCDLILKVDCEGAEYEIIRDLFDNNVLEHFNIIALEWHFEGAESLINLLEKKNFTCISFNKNIIDFPMGLIYGFKN